MSMLTAHDMRAFWDKVAEDDESGCWIWNGTVSNQYGYWSPPATTGLGRAPAHRFAYMHMVGEIPTGLHLDHLCRNKICVNPEHLDPVTPGENVRRGRLGMIDIRRPEGVDSDLATLGLSYRVLRDGARLTVEELALKAGVGQWQVSRFETGEVPAGKPLRTRMMFACVGEILAFHKERAA